MKKDLGWISFLLLLTACSQNIFAVGTPTPQPTSTPTPEPQLPYTREVIQFSTEDGLTLEGILFLGDQKNTGIVFAHMSGPNDQENWVPFAEALAGKGYSSMTSNFRCYGESDCQAGTDPGYVILNRDINAAVDYMKSQGFSQVICIGASMGGRACTEAAFEQELAGILLVSGAGSENPDRQDPHEFISPEMPKLFIISENDPTGNGAMVQSFMEFYEDTPDPKTLKSFPGTIHGTEFFDTRQEPEFSETLLNFIGSIIVQEK